MILLFGEEDFVKPNLLPIPVYFLFTQSLTGSFQNLEQATMLAI